jgi:hypothetical protein
VGLTTRRKRRRHDHHPQNLFRAAGGFLFAIALFRANVLAKWAAALLALATLATVATGLVPQYERLFAIPTGVAMVALGHSLWRDQRALAVSLGRGEAREGLGITWSFREREKGFEPSTSTLARWLGGSDLCGKTEEGRGLTVTGVSGRPAGLAQWSRKWSCNRHRLPSRAQCPIAVVDLCCALRRRHDGARRPARLRGV